MLLGVLEERGVAARVAEHHRVAIDEALARHHRRDHVFRGVGHLEEVHPGGDTELVAHTDERLDGCIAGARAEASGGPIDLLRAGADSHDGVSDPDVKILVPMEPDLGVVPELGHQRGHSVGDLLHDERAGRVDDVHALAAGVGHDSGLLREDLRRLGVAHHEEADGLQADLAGVAEVLDRHVGLGAVSGDTTDLAAVVTRSENVVLDSDPGEGEESDLRVLRGLRGGLDELLLVGSAEAVVERSAAEAVAVGHLDDRHAGAVERTDHRHDVLAGELVTLVV